MSRVYTIWRPEDLSTWLEFKFRQASCHVKLRIISILTAFGVVQQESQSKNDQVVHRPTFEDLHKIMQLRSLVARIQMVISFLLSASDRNILMKVVKIFLRLSDLFEITMGSFVTRQLTLSLNALTSQ